MEEAPLLARKVLGSLRAANPACEEALAALDSNTVVRLRITKTTGNVRRNALYWAVLAVAAPMLTEKAPGINARLLHKVLKDRYGLVSIVTLPSGDQVKDYESTSFAKMTEDKRAEFVTWALATLASWLGCTADELLNEGRAVAA